MRGGSGQCGGVLRVCVAYIGVLRVCVAYTGVLRVWDVDIGVLRVCDAVWDAGRERAREKRSNNSGWKALHRRSQRAGAVAEKGGMYARKLHLWTTEQLSFLVLHWLLLCLSFVVLRIVEEEDLMMMMESCPTGIWGMPS